MTMKPTKEMIEAREKWLKRMEANADPQGKNYLRDACGGFCCLGLAGDCFRPNGWGEQEFDSANEALPYSFMRTPSAGLLQPEIAQDVLGLYADSEGNQVAQELLAGMNDDGKSFPEIAEYIRKHPEHIWQEQYDAEAQDAE